LLVCAAVAGTTWKVCHELFVRPRDEKIASFEKERAEVEKKLVTSQQQVRELNTDKQNLEQQISDFKAKKPLPGEVVVDFHEANATSAGLIIAPAPYLHPFGISVKELKPEGSEVVLHNNRALYEGKGVKPTTSQYFLTQTKTKNIPASFKLVFAEPCDSMTFTRPELYANDRNGVTHPAWSAHALDDGGEELSSHSEGIIRSFTNVLAQTYTLIAPGLKPIVAVRFDSDGRLDGRPFAAFDAILIERMTLFRRGK